MSARSRSCSQRSDPEKCRADAKEAARRHRERNPGYYSHPDWSSRSKERQRDYKLKYNYGFSVDEYDSLYEKQQGRCAICHTDNPGGPHNRLYVDHDHITGKIRGLLCQQCNLALGLFKDSQDILGSAIVYLGQL
jgi:hypothetical protein